MVNMLQRSLRTAIAERNAPSQNGAEGNERRLAQQNRLGRNHHSLLDSVDDGGESCADRVGDLETLGGDSWMTRYQFGWS